jgi:hypothetical protein
MTIQLTIFRFMSLAPIVLRLQYNSLLTALKYALLQPLSLLDYRILG